MRRELLKIINSAGGNRGVKWTDVFRTLNDQSSIKVDPAEFSEVVKGLFENEGLVKVVGERDKRMIRKMDGRYIVPKVLCNFVCISCLSVYLAW